MKNFTSYTLFTAVFFFGFCLGNHYSTCAQVNVPATKSSTFSSPASKAGAKDGAGVQSLKNHAAAAGNGAQLMEQKLSENTPVATPQTATPPAHGDSPITIASPQPKQQITAKDDAGELKQVKPLSGAAIPVPVAVPMAAPAKPVKQK